MRVFGLLMRGLRTLLGLPNPTPQGPAVAGATRASASALVAAAPAERFAETVPAVAGYARRIERIDHMLAARLQSVARLNAPAGRKPFANPARTINAIAVPQARVGAKRTRAVHSGPRVLRPATTRPIAQVIQFPVRQQVEAAAGDLALAA